MNLYVSNLPFSMDEIALRPVLENFGRVSRLAILRDQFTGVSRGAALVEMPDPAQAQQAIHQLSGRQFDGHPISVREATGDEMDWKMEGTDAYTGGTSEPRRIN